MTRRGTDVPWVRTGRSAPAVLLALLLALGVTGAFLVTSDRPRLNEGPTPPVAALAAPPGPAGAHASAHPLSCPVAVPGRGTASWLAPAVAVEVCQQPHAHSRWWVFAAPAAAARVPGVVRTCHERAPPLAA